MTPSLASVLQNGTRPRASKEVARGMPNVLIATSDSTIRRSMGELLDGYEINTLWADSVAEIKAALAEDGILAFFCGFWLVDGTYRDVISHMKRQHLEVPVVIVCAPTCPQEYKDYLASLNIRTFDFICHPYRRDDVVRILDSAMTSRKKQLQATAPLDRSAPRSVDSPDAPRAS